MKYTTFLLFAILTIFIACDDDDGSAPIGTNLPTLSIENVTVDERDDDQTIEFKVSLSGTNTTNVLVSYAGIGGTAFRQTAELNDPDEIDFEVKTQEDGTSKLVFGPNETEKFIEVVIFGDNLPEIDEVFEIRLFNEVNATLLEPSGIGTIVNDDVINPGNPLVIPDKGYTSPTSYPGFNLVWEDDFNGTELDTDCWTYEIGNGSNGWGNNELQFYREENTQLVDGHLVITAKEENFGGFNYTSSRLVTMGKKEFKFGRIDIRAALPEGQGIWPALWMLGSDFSTTGWPACGEIDIMELVGHLPSRVHGTVHFGENLSQHQHSGNNKSLPGGEKFSEEFHVFSLNWAQNQIQFLVDDVVYHSVTPANMNGQPYPFNQPFFFIFNVAVGGIWPGSPDASTLFPQRMIVDYIRVFQL